MAKFPPGPWDGEADRADLTHAAEEGWEMTPRGFAAVGLDHPKTYGVSLVFLAGNRPGALRYVTDDRSLRWLLGGDCRPQRPQQPHRPRSKSWTRWLYGHFAGLMALGEIDANPVRAR